MQHLPQFEHERGNAAGVPEVLDRIPPGRLHVGEHRDPPVNAVEVVDADVHAGLTRHDRQVQQGVRRSAGGGVQG